MRELQIGEEFRIGDRFESNIDSRVWEVEKVGYTRTFVFLIGTKKKRTLDTKTLTPFLSSKLRSGIRDTAKFKAVRNDD